MAFYNAFGFEVMDRIPIREDAVNVFMGLPDDSLEPRLELTYNIRRAQPDEIGLGFGRIAITALDLDEACPGRRSRASSPSGGRARSAKAARHSASSGTQTITGSS